MKKIVFLSARFYDFKNKCLTIGGVQSYLTELINICKSLNIPFVFYQMGDCDKQTTYEEFDIHQIKVPNNDDQTFTNLVYKQTNHNNIVAFYATESIVPKKMPFDHAIAIQHGISWDVPCNVKRSSLRELISKLKRDHKIFCQVGNLKQMVCVDYNYVNWLRTQLCRIHTKLIVIPNYTKIAPLFEKPKDRINIIFARRLFEYRGTRIFTTATKRILAEYPNVHITIAGTGPDENYMKQELASFSNVEFIKYKSFESLDIHADKHIAVVPTVGSEGTSLSLLEAMSAQCAVIASNVGGMTNIILDDYNGLMVNAGDAEDLYRAIKSLLDTPTNIVRLSEKAYETASQAFSYEKWASKWTRVLKSIVE